MDPCCNLWGLATGLADVPCMVGRIGHFTLNDGGHTVSYSVIQLLSLFYTGEPEHICLALLRNCTVQPK